MISWRSCSTLRGRRPGRSASWPLDVGRREAGEEPRGVDQLADLVVELGGQVVDLADLRQVGVDFRHPPLAAERDVRRHDERDDRVGGDPIDDVSAAGGPVVGLVIAEGPVPHALAGHQLGDLGVEPVLTPASGSTSRRHVDERRQAVGVVAHLLADVGAGRQAVRPHVDPLERAGVPGLEAEAAAAGAARLVDDRQRGVAHGGAVAGPDGFRHLPGGIPPEGRDAAAERRRVAGAGRLVDLDRDGRGPLRAVARGGVDGPVEDVAREELDDPVRPGCRRAGCACRGRTPF